MSNLRRWMWNREAPCSLKSFALPLRVRGLMLTAILPSHPRLRYVDSHPLIGGFTSFCSTCNIRLFHIYIVLISATPGCGLQQTPMVKLGTAIWHSQNYLRAHFFLWLLTSSILKPVPVRHAPCTTFSHLLAVYFGDWRSLLMQSPYHMLPHLCIC